MQESKQFRIVQVESNTRRTPISTHFEKILCAIRNRLLPILNKILDNGRIPTGRQVEEVVEEVRAMYFKHMKTDGGKAGSGDSGEEEEGAPLSAQMEDFHPHEYYILRDWGPTVIGGRGHVNFLKNAEDMQESLGDNGSRTKFRGKKRSDEDAELGNAKRRALSDSLFNGNTPPSPAASSVSNSSTSGSKMQELALKKLEHDIFKSNEDAKTNLRQTLAETVVRHGLAVPAAIFCSACCYYFLQCLLLFFLLTSNRLVHRRLPKNSSTWRTTPVKKLLLCLPTSGP